MGKTRVVGTTIDAIQAAEAELGQALPKSFVDWILKNNSISIGALNIFPIFDSRDPRKTWESITHHFNKDWREWQDNFSDEPIDLSSLIPFAEFGTGDYYCFDYETFGDSEEPVIVLWSHETGRATQVADSFATFLSMRGRPG